MRAQAGRIAKGNEGEHAVAALLDVLDGAGWVVLNDRYKSARSPANLDHVVVGPAGVFVIDAKNWSGRIALDDRGLACRGWRKDEELRSAGADAELVRQLAEPVAPGLPVTGVLAFVQDPGLVAPVDHGGAVLLHAPQLLTWLTSLPRVLSPQQVHQVGSTLDTALPPRSGRRRAGPTMADLQATRRSTRSVRSGTDRAAPRQSAVQPSQGPSVAEAALRTLAKGVAVGVLFLLVLALLPSAIRAFSPFVEHQLVKAVTPRPASVCQVRPTCAPAPTTGIGAAAPAP